MRLIGYYKWWIFTPYQLYCALIKAGYKSFWDQDDKTKPKKSIQEIIDEMKDLHEQEDDLIAETKKQMIWFSYI